MEYYIAQVFGFCALVSAFLCYQKDNKKDFLIIQIFANAFYGLQYIALKAYSGCVSCLIAIIKTIVFYIFEKKDKEVPSYILLLFEVAFIVGGVITYTGIYSLIPVVINCIYTFGTWLKNLKLTYGIAIGTSILWMVYSIIIGAHVVIIGNITELIASSLGLKKLFSERKEEKC